MARVPENGCCILAGNGELKRLYSHNLVQKGLEKSRIADARNVTYDFGSLLLDQIENAEFCLRGQLAVRGGQAGMPDFNSGPAPQ
jgi:hypothetical protein